MPPTDVLAGEAYSFRPAAVDPDGQPLSFEVRNKPDWSTFNKTTGRLSGTPDCSRCRDLSERRDLGHGRRRAGCTAAVHDRRRYTEPAAGDQRRPDGLGDRGQAYSFTPTASDPDGQTLSFTIANKPSWATFNAGNGRLSGTPAAANVGSYSGIVISVSDGTDSAALPAFTLTVASAANQPPVISGAPPVSVTVGQAYSFTPTASDPDGQTLTFTIANKPSWASFNASTGRLSGTPAAADAGAYAGIVISVSDGTDSASLPGFTLTVQQVQLGSATVSWIPPTENTDQTALTNLKGYRVKYGTRADSLDCRDRPADAGHLQRDDRGPCARHLVLRRDCVHHQQRRERAVDRRVEGHQLVVARHGVAPAARRRGAQHRQSCGPSPRPSARSQASGSVI